MSTKATTIPKGYKQTEIGVIPVDWDIARIGDIFRVTRGQVLSMKKLSSTQLGAYQYPVYSSQTENNGLAGYYNDYLFENCITWTTDGANAGEVRYRPGRFYCTNVCGVLENKDGYSNVCVASIFNSVSKGYVSYVGNPKLMNNVVADIRIAIPKSIDEQVAISNSISDIDSFIEKLRKLIKKKKYIKQGVMYELLSGKRRLSGFKKEWLTTELGEVANFDRGQGLSKADLSENGKYKCIHYGQLFTEYKELIADIKSKTSIDGNLSLSKANDVLMPTSDVTPRGLATASCIKEDGVVLGGGILVVRLYKGYDGLFLSYFISQNKNEILKLVKGSTVFHLYANDLSHLEIRFPEYDEQVAIAKILSDMDIEIEKLESELTKYQKIKQGMMQTLLTGKIRLIK